jgi:hypothetical protein
MWRFLGLAVVCGALLLAAPVAQASVISWEGTPSPPSPRSYMAPVGVAVSGSTVYISDGGLSVVREEDQLPSRIVKFDLDGNYLGEWAPPGAGVVTDAAGNLYLLHGDDGSVQKYNADGSPAGPKIGGCSGCHVFAAAVDADGNVYISRETEVDKYNPTGALIRTWGPFSFSSWGVAVAPNGSVYITQREPGRIDRLVSDGTLEPVFDASFPAALVIDGAGNFMVVDGKGVEKFDPSGHSLGLWKVYGGSGIALDSLGRIFHTVPARNQFQASGGTVYRLDTRDEAPSVSLVRGAEPERPLASQLITLDASGTEAPRLGTITKYEWDLDGNGSFETDGGMSPTIEHRFLDVGPQTVSVRVTGSYGFSAAKSLTLNVGFPDAQFHASRSAALTGDPVTFDATGFTIPFSQTERFQWDLNNDGVIDVDTGKAPTLEHTFTTPQHAVVAVYVTRSGGRVDTNTVPVDVRLAPPPGEPGVTINDGAFATNDPHVTLTLTWPAYSASAIASNDGGFGANAGTSEFDVVRHVPWTLRTGSADRLPRTVYVHYKPFDSGATYTDDIVLDQGLPIVSSARAAHRVLRVIGADYNTGIRTLMVQRAGAKGALRTMQLGSASGLARRHLNVSVRLPRGLKRAYVRAVDVAGNRSRWRRVSFR